MCDHAALLKFCMYRRCSRNLCMTICSIFCDHMFVWCLCESCVFIYFTFGWLCTLLLMWIYVFVFCILACIFNVCISLVSLFLRILCDCVSHVWFFFLFGRKCSSLSGLLLWDTAKLGALKKEIWVLVRAPLFWVVVWNRHLFFIQ